MVRYIRGNPFDPRVSTSNNYRTMYCILCDAAIQVHESNTSKEVLCADHTEEEWENYVWAKEDSQ